MPDFGIIIMDDENKDKYAKVVDAGYDIECYKLGSRLVIATKLLLLSLTAVASSTLF